MKKEIWKNILGYEGYYQINNIGNIKSLLRKKEMHHGGIRVYGNIVLSNKIASQGYYQCMLCKNGIKKYLMVARLVALAFLPIPKKERKYINHINGVKTDNRVENLEWCTQSENQLHAIKMGLQKNAKGEQRGAVCKLKNSEVIIIKKKTLIILMIVFLFH